MTLLDEERVTLHRTIEGTGASHGSIELAPEMAQMLQDEGIEQLYQHQTRALQALDDGDDVVVSTPTASGKSMIYTLPALQHAQTGGRTLYVAPMTALINDQTGTLRDAATRTGLPPSSVQKYTGQLDTGTRKQVRRARPQVLLSTIDMLHMSILPYGRRSTWDWFLKDLELVVVDELHAFRGVFGSQVALVFRRLQRLLDEYGQDPSIVACSATIGNPVEHAQNITGRQDWVSIEEDTSASGDRDWFVVDNDDSPHPVSMNVAEQALDHGQQTLLFTRARQTAERYAMRMRERLEDSGIDTAQIHAYHAALTTDQRTDIESALQGGQAGAVWSTTALELGIDIGSLDTVVLDGYPGSRMQLHQQAGRAGRGEERSQVVLVPGTDQLDQHIRDHPGQLFDDVEDARVNPANTEITARHLGLAARELPLRDEEPHIPAYDRALEKALEDGHLRDTASGYRPGPAVDGRPFGLRHIDDDSIALVDTTAGERVTELNYSDAITDAYPDALYLHQGTQYEVQEFDRDDEVVWMQPVDSRDYYTQPMKDKDINVLERLYTTENEQVEVGLDRVQVDGSVNGYYRKRKSDHTTITEYQFMPDEQLPFSFPTEAITLALKETPETTELGDGLHAAEHTSIGVIPLHVLCDRRSDLGGLSVAYHTDTSQPTIFIHEGHPGGVGLLRSILPDLRTVIQQARQDIEDCDCQDGCDSCIFSPTCGNANNHLDKDDGIAILRFLEDALPDIDGDAV